MKVKKIKKSTTSSLFNAAISKYKDFLSRRPHRSFRLSRRRDYVQSLELPGYISLTQQVLSILAKNKRVFVGLALIYAVFAILLSGVVSQDAYQQIRAVIDQATGDANVDGITKNLALVWGVIVSQLVSTSGESAGSPEQIIITLVGLYMWLTVVWLVRSIMAGKRPKIRDGLYASGGPVIALVILVFVLMIQLVPAALALIVYGAADTSGLLDQTAVLMLFGGGAFLLVALSLYWSVATFLAMIIITLPGMYPMSALRIAGDLAVGRRTKIILRLLWSILILAIVWLVVLLVAIALDGVLKSAIPDISWLPLVPASMVALVTFSLIFEACYVYVFYRKVVDDVSKSA